DTESKLSSDGDHVSDPTLYRILAALKRILLYVKGTLDYGLQLYASSSSSLVAYSDADWAGCPATRRSTSSYCVFLVDNLLSWSAKCQHTFSQSNAEAEYRGIAIAVAETAWLHNSLCELLSPLHSATLVYYDNVSAIYLTANPIQHQRTKHIDIDIHFGHDMVTRGYHVVSRAKVLFKVFGGGFEKKAKLFNEWERNKHFPEKIASNLKFLNNLQPEWSRHVTIVHQTKDLHTADYTQLYDFLKYNQKEVDELKSERLAKTQDPLALMANSNNPYDFPAPYQDQSSFNQNYLQQPMPNPEDITDPTTIMNMTLTLMAKAFKLNYSTPTNNDQRISSNPRNRGVGHYARNCTVRPRRRDAAYLQTKLLIAQKEEAGIQLQEEEYDLMADASDLDEIEEVNANCILMANLQQASTLGIQTDSAPVYDTDGSAEEAAKFVGDFNSLANEADASLAKHKELELEIERLLKAVVSQDIMIIVQNESVVDTTYLQTELEHTKERFENCIIKKETEYAKLWNDWYKKCDECEYDKISYDKAYKDMQQKNERLQAQLGDLKGKSKDTSCVSDTRNLLFQKLENANVELEFQVLNYARENAHLKATYKNLFDYISVSHTQNQVFQKLENANEELEFQVFNYARENAHLKTTYKNLFDSISVTRAQTETKIASLQNELQCNIYKNAKLRTQLFKKVSEQKDNNQDLSKNTKFGKQPIAEIFPKIGETNALSKPVTTVRLDNTKTRRPQPKRNTKNDRVPSASKSSRSKNKEVKVEEHHRNLLLSKKNKHSSSACNNSKIDSQDVISKVVCAICKKCLISVNHDECLVNYVNGKKSRGKKHKPNVSKNEMQKKYQPKASKPNNVGSHKSLATPKPRKPRFLLRWSPTGRLFDQDGKLVASSKSKSQVDCSNGCSKQMTGNLKLLINFVWKFMRTVRFGNDHVAAILGFGDLQWGNILITRVYFVEGLGHNLFSVGQFYDSDLEVAFRRNACFVRKLEGVDFLKGDRSTNLYTINLHEMASASPICLMARASSTKSWLWHQRLSHLNFDTINDLARNDNLLRHVS
nr:ribonuclease H-like domain-containing protein [Tanacetum cinerariifolium]